MLVDVARPERLARHCTSCGYHWDEAPLDAPPTSPDADAPRGPGRRRGPLLMAIPDPPSYAEATATARVWLEELADSFAQGVPAAPAPPHVREIWVHLDPPPDAVAVPSPESPTVPVRVPQRLIFEATLDDGRKVSVVRHAPDEQMGRNR
ncbi:hypothetical protein ACFOY2_45990 [Nonomuraea purpurea]|uniref:Uncharacterized protein n=1 Tax=Nonomuraea purpurea TaxID=1849276 RepID=A0ABV8GNW6_9ACTN